jgi:hypothetical protein
VAISFAVVNYLLAPVSLRAARRLTGGDLRSIGRRIVTPLLAAAGMAVAILGLKNPLSDIPSTTQVVAYVAVGILVYLGLLRLIDRTLWKEAVALARIATPRRKPAAGESS